jgi:signal transduction histidine kinase
MSDTVDKTRNGKGLSLEDPPKYLPVWHLIWIVPLIIAIFYAVWDYIDINYITWSDLNTMRLVYSIRGTVIAFVITVFAVFYVLRAQRQQEAKLRQALAELKELDQSKNNFLSNVSHELKTPLTTINGYVKFMLSKKTGELSEKQDRYLHTMSDECDRLQHHIEELLFIATLESKPMVLKQQHINLTEMGEEIKARMRPKAEQKKIELTADIKPGLSMTNDEERMFQLVSNLVDNAIKYTNDGGKILITIDKVGEDINLRVTDTGIGIPADKQAKVFERFYQVDSSQSRQYGGTGLGLAICREIIRASKGDIKIVSPLLEKQLKELGAKPNDSIVGTMFDIHLPMSIAPKET